MNPTYRRLSPDVVVFDEPTYHPGGSAPAPAPAAPQREGTPASYINAAVRAVLPQEVNGHQGLSFDLENGLTVRLYLDPRSVKFLQDCLGVRPPGTTGCQSASSGLSPSVDKSTGSDH